MRSAEPRTSQAFTAAANPHDADALAATVAHFGPSETARVTRVRCGVDAVDIDAFERIVRVGGRRFLARVYQPAELAHCGARLDRLATRFAAKEAVAKALGTGFRGLGPRDIEVVTAPDGRPSIVLYGPALQRAQAQSLARWSVSLTHTRAVAVAFAVAFGDEAPGNPARSWPPGVPTGTTSGLKHSGRDTVNNHNVVSRREEGREYREPGR